MLPLRPEACRAAAPASPCVLPCRLPRGAGRTAALAVAYSDCLFLPAVAARACTVAEQVRILMGAGWLLVFYPSVLRAC